MMSAIQFIGVMFGIAMLYFTYIKYKKDDVSQGVFFLLQAMWVALIIISIYPRIFEFVSKDVFNIQRPLDLLYIFTMLFLLGAGFLLYCESKRTYNKVLKLEEAFKKW